MRLVNLEQLVSECNFVEMETRLEQALCAETPQAGSVCVPQHKMSMVVLYNLVLTLAHTAAPGKHYLSRSEAFAYSQRGAHA